MTPEYPMGTKAVDDFVWNTFSFSSTGYGECFWIRQLVSILFLKTFESLICSNSNMEISHVTSTPSSREASQALSYPLRNG